MKEEAEEGRKEEDLSPHLANEDVKMETDGLTFPQSVGNILKLLFTRKK